MEKLNIHYFQHVPFEGLGCIADWISEKGHNVSHTPWYEASAVPTLREIDWLIVMGGPMGIYDEAQYPWLRTEKEYIAEAIAQKKKVLGICLGAQLVAGVLGARVYPNREKEIGWFPVQFASTPSAMPVASLFPPELTVLHWHGDTFDLPQHASRFASTPVCLNQGFVYDERVAGLQFHFEVTQHSLDAMIQHCAAELVPAPYIQSASAMRTQSHLSAASNALMYKLLDHMATL